MAYETDPEVKLNKVTSSDSERLNSRIDRLDTLIHAFWIMFQKNGYTNEMLDEAISEALQIEQEGAYALKGMVCPNCGRNAQLSGHFKIKCIYCGMESILNPYEGREIAKQMEDAITKQKEEDEQKKRWEDAVSNNPYQPYDVTKDLGFDEFDAYQ